MADLVLMSSNCAVLVASFCYGIRFANGVSLLDTAGHISPTQDWQLAKLLSHVPSPAFALIVRDFWGPMLPLKEVV